MDKKGWELEDQEDAKLSYREFTTKKLFAKNQRFGVHVWLDAKRDGIGMELSTNHNLGEFGIDRVIVLLESALSHYKKIQADQAEEKGKQE